MIKNKHGRKGIKKGHSGPKVVLAWINKKTPGRPPYTTSAGTDGS